MKIMKQPCPHCGGKGFVINNIAPSDAYPYITTTACSCCGGTGYIEHTQFSGKEARIIAEKLGFEIEEVI